MTNGNKLETLGQRLRHLRCKMDLTQEQLALRAGTNQAVIQKIENGKSLRPRKIYEIAAALEVNPAWLMFGEDRASRLTGDACEVAELWLSLPTSAREQIRAEMVKMG